MKLSCNDIQNTLLGVGMNRDPKRNAVPVTFSTSDNSDSGSVTVGTIPMLIIHRHENRSGFVIQNGLGSPVYVGNQNVSTSNGFYLGQNKQFSDNITIDEIWAVCATGSTTIYFWEV
jgi:hypothetical protein